MLWILVRLAGTAVLALAADATRGASIEPSGLQSLVFVLVATAAGFADVARRRERAFLENFGVTRTTLVTWFAPPAALGELAVHLLHAAVAR